MKNILVAVFGFLLIQLYYRIFVIRKNKKYDPNRASSEVKLIVNRYNIDMKKIDYVSFLRSIALINSLDVALILFWVTFIDKLNLECLVGFVLTIPTILISYSIFGNYLVKKGLVINDEKHKRNRK